MAAEKDYTRLGIFLLVALVAILITAMVFIQSHRDRPAVELVTYMDQNVVGLRTDSPVRFKGVTVGRVKGLSVDTDSLLVEVIFELFLDRLTGLSELSEEEQRGEDLVVPEAMRTMVMGNPVTGDAYLLIDTPRAPPPPLELGFEPTLPYIPSVPSAMAAVMDQMPQLIERGLALVDAAEELVAQIGGTLEKTDGFLTTMQQTIAESDIPRLSFEVQETLAGLESLLGEEGTVNTFMENTTQALKDSDLAATTESLRSLVDSARSSLERANLALDDGRRALPALVEAAEQLGALARHIEEQSEAVFVNTDRQEEQP